MHQVRKGICILLDIFHLMLNKSFRVNTALIAAAFMFYLAKPLLIGKRSLPTPISINGEQYFSLPVFLSFFAGQIIHGICVVTALSGYDAIFIQCIMLMKYKFRTMSHLLELLQDCHNIAPDDQTDILEDLYKMHLNVLK